MSYNHITTPETGETAEKEVVETYIRETNDLIHIWVNGEEIVTTPTHPFYVPEKGWTDAIDLRAGDILVLVNGEYVVIEEIQHEITEEPVTVYNFQVADFHTYYAGESSVLVHNANYKTDTDLYAFGNATEPKGGRAKRDFGLESDSSVIPSQSGAEFPLGASAFNDPQKAPVNGHYYVLQEGTVLPDGLGVVADGVDVNPNSTHSAGHNTFYPTQDMSVSDFNALFGSLDWNPGGKKK